ncbi:Pca regulon regulatory protein [Pigmentiphaga humi]|uniref:Pca regulon regulatory protein n=1 Tax=Pigmentiphaga humi TaxID=2478468 RepID=A0A3P4B5N4_9BURK|nr:IclR family transcriptional regulator [Pigmentiphaga humi]VCU71211.1 Pca regulon regulatory protein [Pigmentiphaga humi]
MSKANLSEEVQDKYLVPALERGLLLLGQFNHYDRKLSAPELARRLSLPRSTVFRLLMTLESMGFVQREPGGHDYRLGLAVLRLGFEYLASLELTELGTPLLERLRGEIGFSCNLVVRDGRSIVYVAKSSAPTPFASSVHVGTRLPAHATVLGRVLLEDLSLEELRELFPEEHLQSYSSSTPATVQSLYELVQEDRERGYVLQEAFFEARVSTVAAPVRDGTGRIVAALGATIPSSRFEPERIDELVAKVRSTALELSRLLNYSPEKMQARGKASWRP